MLGWGGVGETCRVRASGRDGEEGDERPRLLCGGNKYVHSDVGACIPPVTHDSGIIDCCFRRDPREPGSHHRCTLQRGCHRSSMPRRHGNHNTTQVPRGFEKSPTCRVSAIDPRCVDKFCFNCPCLYFTRCQNIPGK